MPETPEKALSSLTGSERAADQRKRRRSRKKSHHRQNLPAARRFQGESRTGVRCVRSEGSTTGGGVGGRVLTPAVGRERRRRADRVRSMLAAHPLAVAVGVTLGLLWLGGLVVPEHAQADSVGGTILSGVGGAASTVAGLIPGVGPIVSGLTGGGGGGGIVGAAGGLVTSGVGSLVGGAVGGIFTQGFGALLSFIFGPPLTDLASSFLHDLLNVVPLSGQGAPAGLEELHTDLVGAGFGLLTLSFAAAALGYWLSSYTSSGAEQAARGFTRTVGAVGLLICSPYIFSAATEAVNQLTYAIIKTPVVANGMDKLFAGTFAAGLLSQGGAWLIAAVVAAVIALVLLVVKITITALLAVLYVLSPLAIGLWPVEQLSWLLRVLVQVAFVALIFPVLWAVCFGVFAVLSPDFSTGLLQPLFGVAALIVAFKLPFALLRIATGAGLMPSPGKAMSAAYHARGLVRA